MKKPFVLAGLLWLALWGGQAQADEGCQWDGMKKMVWIDDFDQTGIKMAYLLPSDLFIRNLTPDLALTNKVIVDHRFNHRGFAPIHSAQQKSQIIVKPKLFLSDYDSNMSFIGAEFGGKTSVTLQVSLVDNFAGGVVRDLYFKGAKAIPLKWLSNTQLDLHDQALSLVGELLPTVLESIVRELDCIPYGARAVVASDQELLIDGGQRNNLKPRMTLAVLAVSDSTKNTLLEPAIAFNSPADVVLTSVNPAVSKAKILRGKLPAYQSLMVTVPPKAAPQAAE